MSRLPVIVGYGGINPAGRSSCLHGYRRLVIDALDQTRSDLTYQSLAALMNLPTDALDAQTKQYILDHTLIRKMESNLFDPCHIIQNKSATMNAPGQVPLSFFLKSSQIPENIPDNWTLRQTEGGMVEVTVEGGLDVLFPTPVALKVNAAGQLPTGFNPEKLYQSRNHPRGMQLTVYAASDAINSLGID
ncbi:MAG: beta-ketoacyl synthase, partial [Gammaproteobacteria bacterium]|nr:beta-ketoacyl synthase [Gammaproteobacteria bacterium]